jgi:hypothetical protein
MRDHGVEIHSLYQAKFLDKVKEILESWTWKQWSEADKETRDEVAAQAIAELLRQVDQDEAWNLWDEWSAKLGPEDFKEDLEEAALKTYCISYRDDEDVKHSFTVQARNKEEAEQIGWSRVDADSIYVSEVITEATEVDPVQQKLNELEDYEFEYDGFEREWYEDRFDPNSWYGHYQVGGTHSYGSYTYKQDAVTVFEDVRDEMIPKFADKVKQSDLIKKCKELDYAAEHATDDTEDAAIEALELFIVENLDDLVDEFYQPLLAKYAEQAREWAEEHLDPED